VIGANPATRLFRSGQPSLPRTSGLAHVMHQAQVTREIPSAEGLAELAGARRRSRQMILQPVTGTFHVGGMSPQHA